MAEGDTFAVAALVRKRAEVAADVVACEERLKQLRADLFHLDAALRLLDPSARPDGIAAKRSRRQNGWFSTGELPRIVLDVLREAPEPLTVPEVALAVMERRGLDAGDKAAVRVVEKRVDAALRRREGTLERVALGPRAGRLEGGRLALWGVRETVRKAL